MTSLPLPVAGAVLGLLATAPHPGSTTTTSAATSNVEAARSALQLEGPYGHVCFEPLDISRPVFCVSAGQLSQLYPDDAIALGGIVFHAVETWAAKLKLQLDAAGVATQFGAKRIGCTGVNENRAVVTFGFANKHGQFAMKRPPNAMKCEQPTTPGGSLGQLLPDSVGKLNAWQSDAWDYANAYVTQLQGCASAELQPRSKQPGPKMQPGAWTAAKGYAKLAATHIWGLISNGGGTDKPESTATIGVRGFCFEGDACSVEGSCVNTAHIAAMNELVGKYHHDGCGDDSTPNPDGQPTACNKTLADLGQTDHETLAKHYCEFISGTMEPGPNGTHSCSPAPPPNLVKQRSICADPAAMCFDTKGGAKNPRLNPRLKKKKLPTIPKIGEQPPKSPGTGGGGPTPGGPVKPNGGPQ